MQCNKCGDDFPRNLIIDNIKRDFGKRKQCLNCSPFGSKKRANNIDYPILLCVCGIRLKKNAKHCSNRQCMTDERQDKYIEDWIGGRESGLVGTTTHRRIRRYLIDIRGAKCERCKWAEINPITKTCPIHLDHIDGNYKNNRPDNFRLLCPNCHALTSTYGALNRGNGRPYFIQKR